MSVKNPNFQQNLPKENLIKLKQPKKIIENLTDIQKFEILIPSISKKINELIKENDICGDSENALKDIFYSSMIPDIKIEDYLKRIVKYSKIEPSTLICGIINIDNICGNLDYIICKNNVYNIIICSIVLSCKYIQDSKIKDKYFAKIGGISCDMLNQMELLMFEYLGFNLYISNELYYRYYKYFMKH